MDRNAQWAKTGKIHTGLLESFLEDDYFSRPWPKSTGRELFNMDWIRCALFDHPNVAPEDVQRTLVRLTAQTIWDAIHAAQPSTREIYVCGGGVFNPVLMLDLAELSQRSIQSTRALGIDPMHVEACAFAWLAWAFDKKKAGNLPAVTRAAGPRILGALYPA